MVREVKATGMIDTKDVMSFMIYHNYSTIGGLLSGICGVIGIIISPVMFMMNDLISGFILAGMGLVYGIVTPIGFYSRTRRYMRTNPVFKHPMTFVFTSDDLKIDLYTGISEIPWQELYQVKVLKKHMLVYVEKNNAFVLPVANFSDEEDVVLVKDFIKRNKLEIPKMHRLEVEIHDENL